MFAIKAVFAINYIINWQLKKNDEMVIDLKNIRCKYNKKILEFKEESATNIIDINNHLYKRIKDDFSMIIDFKENTCEFLLNQKDSCKISITCSMNVKKNKISLQYCIDEDKMNINIEIRTGINEGKN